MKTPFDHRSRGHVPLDLDTLNELASGSDKVAARPIRLDRGEVERLLDRIYKGLQPYGEEHKKHQKAGTHPDALVMDSIVVQDVFGNDKEVFVALNTKPGHGGSVLSGGFGHVNKGRYKGQPIIIVQMNGLYTWGQLIDPSVSRDALRTVLMHELSHAADKVKDDVAGVQGRIPTADEIDMAEYVNDPGEVRAHMRELYEELRPTVTKVMESPLGDEWGLGGTINRFLQFNTTWQNIKLHLTRKNRNRILKGLVTAFEDELPDVPLAPARVAAAWLTRTAASRPKYQDKKEVPKADGKGTTTVYEYGPRQVANRHKEKADRIETLRGRIGDLRRRVKSDLKSKDAERRLTALAIALIDVTYERVGNDESADNGHYGVTGWTMDHITFSKNGKTVTFRYVGKSGVKHEKTVDDPAIISALKDCCGKKEGSDPVLSDGDFQVTSRMVNDYLRDFDITAKDLRGFHANREVQERLRVIRREGPELPRARKERDPILKEEFTEALEGAAEAVGHEPATLRKQYLVPWLEDTYMKDGTVIDRLDKQASIYVATKTQAEREDREAERLVRPSPKLKPSRDDSKRKRVQVDDPDTSEARDKDLSLNYKDNG